MCQIISVSEIQDKTYEFLEDHQAEDATHLVSLADAEQCEQAWEHAAEIAELEVADVDRELEALLNSKMFDESYLQAC